MRRRVFCVPHNGTADVRHLDADLVVAPGVQDNPGQSQGIPDAENLIMKAGVLGSRYIGRADAGGVGASILYQIVFKVSLLLLRNSTQDSKIVLAEDGGLELAAERFCGHRRF